MKTLQIFIAVMLLSLPAMANHNADGTGHDIWVRVNGLVCDFCAQSITTLFKKQAAVDDVQVDLGSGFVTVDLKDQQILSDEVITQLMTDSGYTVVEIKH
ncbi:MAG: heavy-metal-associated domain-containing protein [Micavibrio sp.]